MKLKFTTQSIAVRKHTQQGAKNIHKHSSRAILHRMNVENDGECIPVEGIPVEGIPVEGISVVGLSASSSARRRRRSDEYATLLLGK